MSSPIFVADVNVHAASLQFENYSDSPDPARAGMGNLDWFSVDNPLFDPDHPGINLATGVPYGPKDFPGFVVDVQQPLAQSLSRGGSNEATQMGSLYGPKPYAAIILPDWRFRWGTTSYHIVGDVMFDFVHPLTGVDFGYAMWTIRKGG